MTFRTVISVLVFSVLHYIYASFGGIFLLKKAGGVQDLPAGWTHYGNVSVAWTIPIHLPATIVMAASQGRGEILSFLGAGLLLAGSLLTAYLITSLVIDFLTGESNQFRRCWWKVAVVVLGLSWVPVPLTWSLVYHTAVIF